MLRSELLRSDLMRCQERLETQKASILGKRDPLRERILKQRDELIEQSEKVILEI